MESTPFMFAFHQQRPKYGQLRGPERHGDLEGPGPTGGAPCVQAQRSLTSVLRRLSVEYCAHGNLLNRVLVVSVSLKSSAGLRCAPTASVCCIQRMRARKEGAAVRSLLRNNAKFAYRRGSICNTLTRSLKELFRQVSSSHPLRFAMRVLGTLFCINAHISRSCTITLILCQLSRIILWGFLSQCVFTQSGALLSPWSVC